MKVFAIAAAFAGLAAAAPQGVTSAIAPKESTPAGCQTSYNGEFSISVVNVTGSTTKRDLPKRKVLTMTLSNGVLTDDEGRTGYIAANNQFQFDKPAQTGAIYTSGWSVCSNGTLALGDSAVFYQCLSGTFYNLYDESTGNQCSQIYIDVIGSGTSVSSAADGQVTAASASAVSQISDGQIQATTGTSRAPVTQISDGQIQAPTTETAAVSSASSVVSSASSAVHSASSAVHSASSVVASASSAVHSASSAVVSSASAVSSHLSTHVPVPVSNATVTHGSSVTTAAVVAPSAGHSTVVSGNSTHNSTISSQSLKASSTLTSTKVGAASSGKASGTASGSAASASASGNAAGFVEANAAMVGAAVFGVIGYFAL